MYKRDCTAIAEHACKSPKGLIDVIEFTLCTIQAGLSTVKQQREDIALEGYKSKFLWGKLMHIRQRGTEDFDAIVDGIMLLMKVPNLGMVKASFVMQMLGFNVACIDSHNLTRLGLSASAVKVGDKLKTETKYKKVREYVIMTQLEGSEYWWNTWCEYVAGNRANKMLDTGDVVSKYHVDCVIMTNLYTE